MTSDAQRRMLLALATVIEDDSVLREMFIGAKIVQTPYQPPADDPLPEFGGFTIPSPLYYSRAMDAFFTLPQTGPAFLS
jgi:hypothetical protein